MMKDIFATLYETLLGIFSNQFNVIFNTLYGGGYTYLGITFLLIPLIFFFLFYFVWNNPYGGIWHWLVWLIITALVTFGLAWILSNELIFNSNNQQLRDLLANQDSGYEDYALTLPIKYAIWNAVFAIILGFIYSLIMKQFSKVQTHLPF